LSARVLILHASTGNGHVSAALACQAGLEKHGAEVLVEDALDYAPWAFQTWYRGGYEAAVREAPASWGWLYRISDHPKLAYRFQCMLDTVFLGRLRKSISTFRPDVVLCTHSLPQPKLDDLRPEYGYRMAVVVTDLYPHLMWHRGEPDWFFVPQPWSQEELERRLPWSVGRTSVSGIPVHPAFNRQVEKTVMKAELGLKPDRPAVLVTSGGIGAGGLPDVVRGLAEMPGIQILAVTGRNDAAYADLMKKPAAGPADPIRVLRRLPVEGVADLMLAADMIVGKPGGLTVSEALVAGLPFIVHHPFLIPGQEEDNARFLVEREIGVISNDIADLRKIVATLVTQPERRQRMARNAQEAGRPDAADHIAAKVMQLADRNDARSEP